MPESSWPHVLLRPGRILDGGVRGFVSERDVDLLIYPKAVEETVAARCLEIALATATGPMRRVPGRGVLPTTLAVVVPQERTALCGAAGPVAAGGVSLTADDSPIETRPRENVVHIGPIATPIHLRTLLGEDRRLGEVVALSVEVIEILGDLYSSIVEPRSSTDPVSGVHRRSGLGRGRAEVGVPLESCRAGRTREFGAMPVRPGKPIQVGPIAWTGTRDEEVHLHTLRVNGDDSQQQNDTQGGCDSSHLDLRFR